MSDKRVDIYMRVDAERTDRLLEFLVKLKVLKDDKYYLTTKGRRKLVWIP